MPRGRNSRPWARLVNHLIGAAGGPGTALCQLRLPGCTVYAQTGDHIIPFADRPDLELVATNIRLACHHCNRHRGTRRLDQLPTTPPPSPRWG